MWYNHFPQAKHKPSMEQPPSPAESPLLADGTSRSLSDLSLPSWLNGDEADYELSLLRNWKRARHLLIGREGGPRFLESFSSFKFNSNLKLERYFRPLAAGCLQRSRQKASGNKSIF
jgi:hypothetical protein